MQIKVSGGHLNITESGAKNEFPSLVFLHYFGGAAISWRETIENLADDFHCIAVDLRGFGESQEMDANFEIEDYARNVLDLVGKLDLADYALVGHSMGGKIAFSVVAESPANLRGLILLAPSPPTPEPMADAERKRLRDTHGTRGAAIETIKKSSFREIAATILEEAVEANLQSDETAWKWWLDAGSKRDISDLSAKTTAPIFIAVGEKDENITRELMRREIVSRVNQAEINVIGNAAHLLPLEAVRETAEFIRASVKKMQ